MCSPVTFHDINPDQFVTIQTAAQEALGMNFPGNTGTGSGNGYTVSWNYQPDLEELTLQCTERPATTLCFLINGKLKGLVKNALKQSA